VTVGHRLRCFACKARHLGLCQPLGAGDLGIVARFKSGDRRLAACAHLYHEGDVVNEVYNLTGGWVLLYHLLEDGRRQILEILLPGAFFGLQPDSNQPMSHSAVCATAAEFCVFRRRDIMNLFLEHADLAVRTIAMCARERIAIHDHLTSLGRRTARERIVHLLIEIDHRLREIEPGAPAIVPLTQAQIGDVTGLSEVHVNRILQDLRAEGVVGISRGMLQILRPDKLTELEGAAA
jgi:CRP-like cAMP-binding protein